MIVSLLCENILWLRVPLTVILYFACRESSLTEVSTVHLGSNISNRRSWVLENDVHIVKRSDPSKQLQWMSRLCPYCVLEWSMVLDYGSLFVQVGCNQVEYILPCEIRSGITLTRGVCDEISSWQSRCIDVEVKIRRQISGSLESRNVLMYVNSLRKR